MNIGDTIKYKKRKFGIITDVREGGYFTFVWHNGMKPTHSNATQDDLKLVSREKFLDYIAKSGNNALMGYLKDSFTLEEKTKLLIKAIMAGVSEKAGCADGEDERAKELIKDFFELDGDKFREFCDETVVRTVAYGG